MGGAVSADFFSKKEVWRSWVEVVCHVVAVWDGFECWDWHPFSNSMSIKINMLSKSDLHKFTIRLIAFFVRSFIVHLGYYPSTLLRPPTLAAHSCMVHAKFGYAHHTLPVTIE